MPHCLRWAVWVGFFVGPSVMAATLVVAPEGPYTRVGAAVAAARDGDTILVAPGTYDGDVLVIDQQALTIRGVGERPLIRAAGRDAEGKALWVVRGGDIRIENIAFTGARVADGNGAGIRLERGRLTLHRARFTDNEMGLLTSNDPATTLTITDSEFALAPRHDGALHHLLYVGRIGRLELSGSRFANGWRGHLLKSRARVNRIRYNLLVDGPGGAATYEIDLPNGGDAVLLGNVVWQSADSANPVVVAYGAEGASWPESRLLMAHNTLLSDRPGTWFLRVWADRLPAGTPVRAVNNLTVGLGVFGLGAPGEFDGNRVAPAGQLVAPELLDFGLRPGSMLRGRAPDPAGLAGPEGVPQAQVARPLGTRPLAPPARWSPGAVQD